MITLFRNVVQAWLVSPSALMKGQKSKKEGYYFMD